MRPSIPALRFVLAVLAVPACGGQPSKPATAPRSPSLDYSPPSAQTSDGEVVGADRTSPSDKLATGATVGSEGVQPAAQPASAKPEAASHSQSPPKAAKPPKPSP